MPSSPDELFSLPAGVMTALVTPMNADGAVDLGALRAQAHRQVEAGIAALVPCGTTGETPTLSRDEQRQVTSAVVEAAAGRVPVIAGAGSNSTAGACELARMMADAGCQATLQVAPYYNKPTQDGLFAHFSAVADATELPVVLYNIPGRSAVRLEVDTIARLAEHPRIVAIKDATGDMLFASRTIEAAPDLTLLSGDDALTLPLVALGAKGVVSVAANAIPRQMVELCSLAMSGAAADARALHYRLAPLFRALFVETNPIPVKAAMEILGLGIGSCRLPLQPATSVTHSLLAAALEGLE